MRNNSKSAMLRMLSLLDSRSRFGRSNIFLLPCFPGVYLDNVKKAKILLTITEPCLNPDFPQEQLKNYHARKMFWELSIALVDISWLKASPANIFTNGDWMLSQSRTTSSRRSDLEVLGTAKLKHRKSIS